MNVLATYRRASFPLILALAGLLLLTASSSAQPFTGDHYKVYTIPSPSTLGKIVILKDQFGPDTAQTKALSHFANPTAKTLRDGTNYPIFDTKLHYSWWTLLPLHGVSRTVNVDNQFGGQTLTLAEPFMLWNPALKDNSGPPPVRNHYKCYSCTGADVRVPVTLTDAKDTFQTQAGRPAIFCNPTTKTIPGVAVYHVINADLHYVCYELNPVDNQQFFPRITDQFVNLMPVTLNNARYLCVPTLKVDPTPAQPGSWGRLKLLYR
jgi:hypothetical protein